MRPADLGPACPYCGVATKPFVTSGRPRKHCGGADCVRAYNVERQRVVRAHWSPERRERELAYHRAHRARPPNVECEVCGTPFVGRSNKGHRQRTCSRRCGVILRYGNPGGTSASVTVAVDRRSHLISLPGDIGRNSPSKRARACEWLA